MKYYIKETELTISRCINMINLKKNSQKYKFQKIKYIKITFI